MPRMFAWARGFNESDILHARQPQVGDELTSPAHQTVVLLADYGSADTMFRHSPIPLRS
jgi:hypothetical protein